MSLNVHKKVDDFSGSYFQHIKSIFRSNKMTYSILVVISIIRCNNYDLISYNGSNHQAACFHGVQELFFGQDGNKTLF